MIDKTLRKAVAEKHGSLIVVRMTGGEDCIWLNMYLDGETGQMTCDSDIGSYAYHWGRHINTGEGWLSFCVKWLSNEEWLLRKCCGERHAKLEFNLDETIKGMRELYRNQYGEDCDIDALEKILCIANGYDDADSWRVALNTAADEQSVDLPDEWWDCVCEDYTPWQKRFAEICREVIVPELRKIIHEPTNEEMEGTPWA